MAKEEFKDDLDGEAAVGRETGGEMNQEERDIEEAGITCTVGLLD